MNQFNLRVYGFLINKDNQILLSDEFEFDTFFTKFPGGGVKYGEGILNALKREFKEELNAEITSSDFIFFNEFFQESFFHQNVQVTCFYYSVECEEIAHLGNQKYQIPFRTRGEKQRWVNIAEVNSKDLSFPTDQMALEVLRKKLFSS